ncbi:MAG: hypothetical protein FWE13_01445 [Firmicutes bacterium]|nr:hypothetical protein [Bacillota bacterium]
MENKNENKNKKFLKNIYPIMVPLIFNGLGIVAIIAFITIGYRDGFNVELILLTASLGFILMFLPWIASFVFYKHAFSVVIFSPEGIEERVFGKRLKYIAWENVRDVEKKVSDRVSACYIFNLMIYEEATTINESGWREDKIMLSRSRDWLKNIIPLCTNERIKEQLKSLLKQ